MKIQPAEQHAQKGGCRQDQYRKTNIAEDIRFIINREPPYRKHPVQVQANSSSVFAEKTLFQRKNTKTSLKIISEDFIINPNNDKEYYKVKMIVDCYGIKSETTQMFSVDVKTSKQTLIGETEQ